MGCENTISSNTVKRILLTNERNEYITVKELIDRLTERLGLDRNFLLQKFNQGDLNRSLNKFDDVPVENIVNRAIIK